MNFISVIEKLEKKHNGAFFNIMFQTDLKSKMNAETKRSGISIMKVVEMTTRKEIDYDSQKSVIEKVEQGKVLTHELPWGNWITGFEGLAIEYKDKKYIRFYCTPNKAKVTYFVNGVETTYEELRNANYMVNSFFTKSDEKPDAMTINVENILEIF